MVGEIVEVGDEVTAQANNEYGLPEGVQYAEVFANFRQAQNEQQELELDDN